MPVDRGWVSRVGAQLDAMRANQATFESEAWRTLQGDQQAPPPPLDTSPGAVLIRRINRIALAYGWHDVVAHYLDTRGVGYLADLSLPQLEDLASRLEGYLDALEHGHSPPDHPPAY